MTVGVALLQNLLVRDNGVVDELAGEWERFANRAFS